MLGDCVGLDVVSVGELLIDFISRDGGVNFTKAPGGAPANVAVACARLGLRAGFVGKVGSDCFGKFLKGTLDREGVDTSNLLLEKGIGTTLAFVSVDRRGERGFQFWRGADALLRPSEVEEGYVGNSRVLHFGSVSLAAEPSRSATLKAVRIAEKKGLTVTYDPNIRLGLWESEEEAREWAWRGVKKASVVKMSGEEVEFVVGLGVEDGAEELLKFVEKVFISLGSKGCYFADGNSQGYSDPYGVRVKDTTGAGDGFMGGVIYGVLKGWNAERIAAFSNAAGALTVRKVGVIPALPTLDEVLRLVRGKLSVEPGR